MLVPDVALYAYSDDIYLISDQVSMARALAAAPQIHGEVGLKIGWGPGKTELILSSDCDPGAFLALVETVGGGLPYVVAGFSSCLGVPRHAASTPSSLPQPWSE